MKTSTRISSQREQTSSLDIDQEQNEDYSITTATGGRNLGVFILNVWLCESPNFVCMDGRWLSFTKD